MRLIGIQIKFKSHVLRHLHNNNKTVWLHRLIHSLLSFTSPVLPSSEFNEPSKTLTNKLLPLTVLLPHLPLETIFTNSTSAALNNNNNNNNNKLLSCRYYAVQFPFLISSSNPPPTPIIIVHLNYSLVVDTPPNVVVVVVLLDRSSVSFPFTLQCTCPQCYLAGRSSHHNYVALTIHWILVPPQSRIETKSMSYALRLSRTDWGGGKVQLLHNLSLSSGQRSPGVEE